MIKILLYVFIGLLSVIALPFIGGLLLIFISYAAIVITTIISALVIVVGGLLPLFALMALVGVLFIMIVKCKDIIDK